MLVGSYSSGFLETENQHELHNKWLHEIHSPALKIQAPVLKFSTSYVQPTETMGWRWKKQALPSPTGLHPSIRSSHRATSGLAGAMTSLTEDWSAKTRFFYPPIGWTDALCAHGLLNPVRLKPGKEMRWMEVWDLLSQTQPLLKPHHV